MTKTQSSKRHLYQNSTPNLNINISHKEFNGLKKQIDQLENKAKEAYGINFEIDRSDSEALEF